MTGSDFYSPASQILYDSFKGVCFIFLSLFELPVTLSATVTSLGHELNNVTVVSTARDQEQLAEVALKFICYWKHERVGGQIGPAMDPFNLRTTFDNSYGSFRGKLRLHINS